MCSIINHSRFVPQIPYEVCEVVPDIECVNVLKKVPELQCTPEIFEDCNDVEKRVPYLVPEEDCVEVTFEECQEVTNKCLGLRLFFYKSYITSFQFKFTGR